MKFIFVAHSNLTAGAERSLASLARAGVQQGDVVEVTIPKAGPIEGLLADFLPAGQVLKVKTAWWMGEDLSGVMGVLRTVRSAMHLTGWWRVLRNRRPDAVVVISTVTPAPMLASWALRVPLVVVLSESVNTNPTLKSILPKSLIVRFINRWATIKVGISAYSAAQYGGADLLEPPDVLDLAGGAPTAKGLARSGPVLRAVMLGTLSSEKGQGDAVEAVAAMKRAGIAMELEFFGDADAVELEALQRRIQLSGLTETVRHKGTTSHPLEVLRAADLSIVCSKNEAYGRVTAESLLVGTPVVAYAEGGTVEVLAAGGGILVEPNPEALAAALAELSEEDGAYDRLAQDAADRSRSTSTFGDAHRTLLRIKQALSQRRFS